MRVGWVVGGGGGQAEGREREGGIASLDLNNSGVTTGQSDTERAH